MRRWHAWAAAIALLLAYPAATLVYVYSHTIQAALPGGRYGPGDAYRHGLASGFVAKTLSPRAVELVSAMMEGDDEASLMDRHNNAIGAAIGAGAASLDDMQQRVLAAVRAGRVNATDPNQMTWLPPRRWRNLPF
jgi:enoyl-CoA hydratase/carnithine racemase